MSVPRDESDGEPRSAPELAGDISAPLTNSEAVKRALAAGFEAAQEGTAYIRKEFGIDMSTSLFLAVKATGRKKSWTRSGKPGRKAKHATEAGQSPTFGELPARDEDDESE
jgi:hypothetical protein